eukprot:Nk52_evm12s628 gene=Nk52_evmTU12s628
MNMVLRDAYMVNRILRYMNQEELEHSALGINQLFNEEAQTILYNLYYRNATGALERAAKLGLLQVIRKLHMGCANWTGSSGREALGNAVREGHREIVEYLLEKGLASVSTVTAAGAVNAPASSSSFSSSGASSCLLFCPMDALELACEKGNTEIVMMVVLASSDNANAAAAAVGNNTNSINSKYHHIQLSPKCMYNACLGGYRKLVEFLQERERELSPHAVEAAACQGHLGIVKMLIEAGYPTAGAVDQACSGNHPEVVRYLLMEKGLDFTSVAVAFACTHGNVEILGMLDPKPDIFNVNSNGNSSHAIGNASSMVMQQSQPVTDSSYSFNNQSHIRGNTENQNNTTNNIIQGSSSSTASASSTFQSSASQHVEFVNNAAAHGHLNIVKELHERGFRGSLYCINQAAMAGNIDMVKYLISMGYQFSEWVLDKACRNGDLEFLHYIESQIQKSPSHVGMTEACKYGNLEVVKYLQRKNISCTGTNFEKACENGHLEVVRYLHSEEGIEINCNCMDGACVNGHLEVVRYLHEQGVMCSSDGFIGTCAKGHLDIIEFFCANGFKCPSNAINVASMNGHLKIVQFLNDIGEECTEDAINKASEHGHLEVVQYLQKLGKPFGVSAMNGAAYNGHLSVVQFLARAGGHCTNYAYTWANRNGHFHVADFLAGRRLWMYSDRAPEQFRLSQNSRGSSSTGTAASHHNASNANAPHTSNMEL